MSTKHKQAEKDYIKGMKYKDIAEKHGVSLNTVKSWKQRHGWSRGKGAPKNKSVHTNGERVHTKPKRGAPRGNKNALGNRGGPGGPYRNEKAVTHGLFRKFLPQDEEYLAVFDAAGETNPLDMLWTQIQIKFANIVHAQKVMFVTAKEEMIKELKKRKFEIHDKGGEDGPELQQMVTEEEYEFQFAWDRMATALNSQSRAMGQLSSMIRQYEEMCRQGWADDEQQSRIEEIKTRTEKMKAEIDDIKGGEKGQEAEDWTAAVEAVAERRRMKANGE